ncbi:hypothetical protein SAMN05421504_105134 [Amycolatopsis xylanica]|uniref:Uncharacterized protein n=1 Tax=Amycolatopsis xylanica TaxID=589385 RepID=A0A1H3IVF0_9PSEU|nr:hypothetical protein [Amycolatopsis xylanica]SDY31652.1 hypothetical protein SAMN05421504_105134 [Amycolatopsis xylanica]
MTTLTALPQISSELLHDAVAGRPTAVLLETPEEYVFLMHWRPVQEAVAEYAARSHSIDFTLLDLVDDSTDAIPAQRVLSPMGRHGLHFDRPARCRRGMPGVPDIALRPHAVPWLLSDDGMTAIAFPR